MDDTVWYTLNEDCYELCNLENAFSKPSPTRGNFAFACASELQSLHLHLVGIHDFTSCDQVDGEITVHLSPFTRLHRNRVLKQQCMLCDIAKTSTTHLPVIRKGQFFSTFDIANGVEAQDRFLDIGIVHV